MYGCEVCGNLYSIPIILARHLKFSHGYVGVVPTTDTPHDEVLRFIQQKHEFACKIEAIITEQPSKPAEKETMLSNNSKTKSSEYQKKQNP